MARPDDTARIRYGYGVDEDDGRRERITAVLSLEIILREIPAFRYRREIYLRVPERDASEVT